MRRLRRLLLASLLCMAIMTTGISPVSASMGGVEENTDALAQDRDRTEAEIEGLDGEPEEQGRPFQKGEEPGGEAVLEKSNEEMPQEDREEAQETPLGAMENRETAGDSEEEKSQEQQSAAEREKEAVLDQFVGPDGALCDIQSDEARFQRSVNNGSKLQVNSTRYDRFYTEVGQGDYSHPQLAMGIKYIEHDNETPDSGGKWRYVYCLNFEKSSPLGQYLTYKGGWTNKRIAYCLYYGAMFWRQPCRYAKYSTGDWQMDYFVTQASIHILNKEFSMAGVLEQIDKAALPTASEKALAKDKIQKLVNDANNDSCYDSFTADGWFDASQKSTFTVSTPSDFAGVTDGYATGYSTASFTTAYGLDLREQITGFQVTVPGGVSVQKRDAKTYSNFRLFVGTDQYKNWQLTGKTVAASVKATAPKWWGGGIYTAPAGEDCQDCVLWTYTTAGGSFSKTASFNKQIPKKTFPLDIRKTDAGTGAGLSGAVFSLWAFDGTAYSQKLGNFTDKGGGNYSYTGIDYTKTKDGWFLIKEEKAPENYFPEYVLYNNADIENYEKYGGREVQLTADGFVYDGVPDAAVFKDKPMTPKADVVIKKTDADTGAILEGAQFQIYEWDKAAGGYKEEACRTLKYDTGEKRYITDEPLEWSEGNEGKFRVVETKLPQGYLCPWSKEKGTVTLDFEVPNYPARKLTIHKRIKTDEIIWAHGNPAFLFAVSGTDLNGNPHTYHRVVEFTEDYVLKHSTNGYVDLGTTIEKIPAGTYEVVEETPVLRYVLTDAVAGSDNVTVTKKNLEVVNGFQKIEASAEADLLKKDGEVTFENHKTRYDKVSHDSVVINEIK